MNSIDIQNNISKIYFAEKLFDVVDKNNLNKNIYISNEFKELNMSRVQDVPEVDRVIMPVVEKDKQTRRIEQLKKRRISPQGNKKRNKKGNIGNTIDYEG